MKNINDEDSLRKNLRDYLAICSFYFQEEKGFIFMRSLIHYLYSAGDLPAKVVIGTLTAITSERGITAMSTATRLMEIGREKGIEQGRQEGIKTIKKMLMKGISIEDIMEITELSAAEIEKIRNS